MRVELRRVRPVGALLLMLCLVGCSVAMSSQRSTSKGDVGLLRVGAERTTIEATFGPPATLVPLENGRTKATYLLDSNAHTEVARTAAVAGHLAMDLLTLGLWEVVGTPLEIAARDNLSSYILIYGPDHKVQSVEVGT